MLYAYPMLKQYMNFFLCITLLFSAISCFKNENGSKEIQINKQSKSAKHVPQEKRITTFVAMSPVPSHEIDKQFYSFYREDNSSDKSMLIDSCELDSEGNKSEHPFQRPKKLYLITTEGAKEIEYEGTIDADFHTIDRAIKRKLWSYKKVQGFGKKTDILISSPLPEKISYRKLTRDMFSEIKSVNHCKVWKFEDLTIKDCNGIVSLENEERTLISDMSSDTGTEGLVGELTINGIIYYHFDESSTPEGYGLISKFGEPIFNSACYMPWKC